MPPIEWRTLEYSEKDRGADWFWAVGIIVASVAISAIVLENLLFAVFVIIAGIALVLQVLRRPEEILVRITDRGIEINEKLYLYDSLEAFWIEDFENEYKLILKSKKFFVPYIITPIESVGPNDVHEYLLEHLEEQEMHEPLSQRIMEWLGF